MNEKPQNSKTVWAQKIFVFQYSHILEGNKIGTSRIWCTAKDLEDARQQCVALAEQRGHKNVRLGPGKQWG